jgi:hypothetical protein
MLCEQKWECGWLWVRRGSDRKWRQANEREVIVWLASQVEILESRLSAVDGGVKRQGYEGHQPRA